MTDKTVPLLSVKQQGLYICFKTYYAINNKYPETPEELATVTSSLFHWRRFNKYREWFHEYIKTEQVS